MENTSNKKTPNNLEGVLSIDEFYRRLGLGRTLVYKLTRQGSIRSFKVGNKTVIPATELMDWPKRQLKGKKA